MRASSVPPRRRWSGAFVRRGEAVAEQPRIDPWDLDQLPPELLAPAYRDLERFVAWLRSTGIAVPTCWYVHRWSVHRLAVVMHWRSEVTGCGRPAREAAEWWASIWGLQGLRDAWTREGLFDHGEKHFESGREEPTPSLETVVEHHVEEVRRLRAGLEVEAS
jgi:hypothetical protein